NIVQVHLHDRSPCRHREKTPGGTVGTKNPISRINDFVRTSEIDVVDPVEEAILLRDSREPERNIRRIAIEKPLEKKRVWRGIVQIRQHSTRCFGHAPRDVPSAQSRRLSPPGK